MSFVVNFELPNTYNRYKQTASMVEMAEGAIINLVTQEKDKKQDILGLY